MEEIEYKKSSAVMVFNDKGELALQLRSATDNTFPSYWDFSAGGGIKEKEDCKIAAKRELKEELGIDIDIEFFSKEHFIYPAWNSNKIRDVELYVYRANHNGPFKFNKEEIEMVNFFALDKIKEMVGSEEKIHPELKMFLEKRIISDSTI